MITQELIAYIKSELSKDRTREEIQGSLLSGGGWSESDLSEAFRTIMPLNSIASNPIPSAGSGQAPSAGSGQAPSAGSGQAPSVDSGQAPSAISPISLTPTISPDTKNARVLKDPRIFPAPSLKKEKSSLRTIPWKAIILAVLFGGLCFAFYFYRPQILDLPNKATTMFSSFVGKTNSLMQKDNIPVDENENENEISKTPIAIPQLKINCGTTNPPDRKNPLTYLSDNVLKCLGESAFSCKNAEGMIDDTLFPTLFKITNKDNICKFELSYKEDSTLIDVFGKSLANRSISCPLSIVKVVDETDPENLVFKAADTSNLNKYAFDIYFYGTLGLFIENDFNQTKIENLGCSGTFIGSVIESYNLMKSKI